MMNSICIAILVLGLNSNDYKTRELTALSVIKKEKYSEHNLWYLYDNSPCPNTRDYVEKIINERTPKFKRYPMIVFMELKDHTNYLFCNNDRHHISRINNPPFAEMILDFLKKRHDIEYGYVVDPDTQKRVTCDFINYVRWNYRVRPEAIKLWVHFATLNQDKEKKNFGGCYIFQETED